MVCTGNICRSPTMEAVFRARAAAQGLALTFDSAGTASYHVGEPPDPRSLAAARARGYDLSALRARQVRVPEDFALFDRILAADRGHLEWLRRHAPAEHHGKLALLLGGADLPDPYYGGDAGFAHVLALIEDACDGLLAHVQQQLLRGSGQRGLTNGALQ